MANISTVTVGGTQYNIKDSSGTYLPLSGGTMTGTVNGPTDNITLNFRPNNANYYTTLSYQTSGNEALVAATKNNVTSFMFVNGEDSITNHAANRWTELTPGLQIKQNCVSIGALIPSGTAPTYKLAIAGTLNATGAITQNGTQVSLNGHAHSEITPIKLINQNLNDYKPDNFTTYYAEGGNTVTNTPLASGQAFGMYVYRNASGYRVQELYSQDGSKWTRFWNSSSWSTWEKMYGTLHKPNATDIGAAAASHTHSYLPLSGGTLTGNTGVSKAGETYLFATNTTTGKSIYIDSYTDKNGVYSSSGGWLIYADNSGNKYSNCSTDWSLITNKPSSFTPASHDHTGLTRIASRPANPNSYHDNSYGIRTFLATSSMTTSKPPSDAHILHFNWDNGTATTGTWDAQLAMSTGSGLIYRRGQNNGTWGSWYTVYDTGNKPTYSDVGAAAASHNHAASDINSGTLSIDRIPVVTAEKGGSGKTSLADSANVYLNALTTGTANPVDADYYIAQYAGGGTTTTTYHRRPVSALYNYMKGKFDSVYQAKGSYAASSHTHNYAGSSSAGGPANYVTYLHTNEINFAGGKQAVCYFNYRLQSTDAADTSPSAVTYKFCNYTSSTASTTIDAASFTGNAASATKATQDGSGNNIVNTYAKKAYVQSGTTKLVLS